MFGRFGAGADRKRSLGRRRTTRKGGKAAPETMDLREQRGREDLDGAAGSLRTVCSRMWNAMGAERFRPQREQGWKDLVRRTTRRPGGAREEPVHFGVLGRLGRPWKTQRVGQRQEGSDPGEPAGNDGQALRCRVGVRRVTEEQLSTRGKL